MSTFQIVLVGLVVVALLVLLWLRRRGGAGPGSERNADRIDTVTGWPPQATRVLSTPERLALGTLMRALPEYMILAQVPLSRFLNVPKRNSYADWLRRVGYQCVDFVVCDMAAQVVSVVELQPAQENDRGRKRLARIGRTLKAARIPLLVWGENALPSVDAAREAVLPRPKPTLETGAAASATAATSTAGVAAAAATATAATAAAVPAPAGSSPFEDTDRDSTLDERIELLEPPPSTWFDDLDSGAAPLNKR
jgi:hypothetical protein